MKKTFIFAMLFGITLIVGASFIPATTQAQTGTTGVADGCDNPVQYVHVGVDPVQLKYNITTIHVEKNTCVNFAFENIQTTAHDFTVDDPNGNTVVEIELEGQGMNSSNWLMPNKDMAIKFFCEVDDHRAQGMEGDFIIGNPTTTSKGGLPGFTLPVAFVALLAMVAIPQFRKWFYFRK